MSKVFTVKYYAENFGHSAYQVTGAGDALEAALAVSWTLVSTGRKHLTGYTINAVTEQSRLEEGPGTYTVLDAKKVQHA